MAKASRVNVRKVSRKGRKGRKASRKASRKTSRKGRKASRKGRKSRSSGRSRRCWKGGAQAVFPATVDDTSMSSASKLSSAQGNDYLKIHEGQYGGRWDLSNAASAQADYMLEASNSASARPGQAGGAAYSLASSAPPGYTGMLDDSLRAIARVGVLDQSMEGIQGMSDQSGGGKRRGSKKGKSARRRRMNGGAAMTPLSTASDYAAPGVLLSPNQEAQALAGMNPEWKLATDPNAFTPAGM